MHEALQVLAISGVLLLGVVSPGPNFATVTSAAMSGERRAGLLSGLAMGTASGLWALLAVGGIGIVMARWPWISTALRVAGAAYLIWLGGKLIVHARKPLPEANPEANIADLRDTHPFRKAFFVSMTNPKALAFYGSILSAMVPGHAPVWFYATVVGLATVISAGWYCTLALLFSQRQVRSSFARAKVWVDSVMGASLVVMGGKLLASR